MRIGDPQVHVNTAEFEVRIGEHLGSQFVVPLDIHPELVAALARRRLGVRLRVDVGVQPECDRGDTSEFGGHRRDRVEFPFALDVEHQDLRLERCADLIIRLADAGEHDFRRIGAGLLHAVQLAAGDDVEAAAGLAEQLEDAEIRVGLHRVADDRIGFGEGVTDGTEFVEQFGLRVDPQWGTVLFGKPPDRDIFAVKFAVAILKGFHRLLD